MPFTLIIVDVRNLRHGFMDVTTGATKRRATSGSSLKAADIAKVLTVAVTRAYLLFVPPRLAAGCDFAAWAADTFMVD